MEEHDRLYTIQGIKKEEKREDKETEEVSKTILQTKNKEVIREIEEVVIDG